MLSVFYAECDLCCVINKPFMLCVVMLNVVMLSIVMLTVAVPCARVGSYRIDVTVD
jgi:hypothetical protein